MQEDAPKDQEPAQEAAAAIGDALAVVPRPPEYCQDVKEELRQSEIISGLSRIVVASDGENYGLSTIGYSIILTPDCDLLNDRGAEPGKEKLLEVLLFPMYTPEKIKDALNLSTKNWELVKQNRVEQCHHFNAVEAGLDLSGTGIPELVVDFKRYYTLTAAEIYRQCAPGTENGAVRRCRLGDLWRENLQRRAMSFMQRVALP